MSLTKTPCFVNATSTASARTFLIFALAFTLSSPAWAKRLQPVKSVLGDNEDIVVVINCPTPATGDLYIAASAGGALHFYHEDGRWWPNLPAPHDWGQTCSGSKQIILGNTRYIGAGSYSVYQVFTDPNAPDVYDTRYWVGGLNGLGKTRFEIKRPKDMSGDYDGDGWADDDKDHDGFHDDDSDCDGYHDDDIHHVGFNAESCKKGGWASLTRYDGSGFKNQGDCIQYVNTGK